jgi:hypothetical protein
MKKLFVILAASLISVSCLAQNGFYLGYENGFLFDRHHYVNSKGYELSQGSIGGVYGGYVGYKLNSYSLETGFYGYFSSHVFVDYDYATGNPHKSLNMSSGAESWMIPIRLGKEITTSSEKFFAKIELGFNTIICRDYSDDQPNIGFGQNVMPYPIEGDPNHFPMSPDSTRGYGYVTSRVNFGIEPGLTAGYRFKKKADIYLKGSYLANFNPVYYETMTHYSDAEPIYATSVSMNAFQLQIGLKYYFGKREK